MIIKCLLGSAILLLFSYFVFRIMVKNDYSRKLKLSPVSYILEFLVFLFHAHFIYLITPVNWPEIVPLPDSEVLRLISLILIFIGLIIVIIAFFDLGSGPSFGLDKDRLKTNGIYKFSRNPQIAGYGLILLVFTIIILSWCSVWWFIQYIIISYFMIKSEEEFLSRKYGEEYKKYCSSVSRIIIFF